MLLTKKDGQWRYWVDTDHYIDEPEDIQDFEEFQSADIDEDEFIPKLPFEPGKYILKGYIIAVQTTQTIQKVYAGNKLLGESLQ